MSDSYEYKYGFTTDIESETIPKGLNEDILKIISAKKNEPAWVLEYRLKAYRHWLTLTEPSLAKDKWAQLKYPPINFQDLTYYSAPKKKTNDKKSMDEIDPELIKTFERFVPGSFLRCESADDSKYGFRIFVLREKYVERNCGNHRKSDERSVFAKTDYG